MEVLHASSKANLAPDADSHTLGDTTCNFCDDNPFHVALKTNRSVPIDRSVDRSGFDAILWDLAEGSRCQDARGGRGIQHMDQRRRLQQNAGHKQQRIPSST